YNTWLRDQILSNRPLDRMVRDLLTAEGGSFRNPPANFYIIETSPTLMGENVAQVFCGIRVQCAQCHNHPFERWTQDDYYSFAACFVDRVWQHFMGRGIVDPPDDVRVSNPPSHPELREQLARKFVESGYDVRALVRWICNSRAYQRSSMTISSNEKDTRNFSHAMVRRLSAETLLDAVCRITQVPEKFNRLPLGARAA